MLHAPCCFCSAVGAVMAGSVAYAHHAADDAIEPLALRDLHRSIMVPRSDFEAWLARHDWTYHQLARAEFPAPYSSLEEFQLGCICADPYLWCTMFLREPEDPDHDEPYNFWTFQIESLRWRGSVVHKDAAEIGKTREIVALSLYYAFITANGSGLGGAPLQTHLDEIIEGMYDQMLWNPDLKKSLVRWKKHPHHAFYFSNHFKMDFRPSGHDGVAYRGVHVRTLAWRDEAAKDKHKRQWSEFWRALKPGCAARIYSVPDGDRSCEFYKLAERAARQQPASPRKVQGSGFTDVQGSEFKVQGSEREDRINVEHRTSNIEQPYGTAVDNGWGDTPPKTRVREECCPSNLDEEVKVESFEGVSKHIKSLKFRLFQWGKSLMPSPFWTPERKRFYIEQFGDEDSPEYKHNVLGLDGDPEDTVFPWHLFRACIKEVPDYHCLKITVDSANNEVMATGYRCEIVSSAEDIVPKQIFLLETVYRKSTFFNLGDDGESEFRRLIKGFFLYVPGLKRGGADLGFSGDPSEITVTLVLGRRERKVARLYLKHVTYDQQCQALDALDDLYGAPSVSPAPPQAASDIIWGTDFGNAGSAVAHDLQGLPQYAHKHYEDRLRGFMFESTSDNVDEDGNPIIDAKTNKPVKITLKELATDLLVKKMQRQELEYPPDPDYVFMYPNHTCHAGEKHRIYKKTDDHLIDSDRVQKLAGLLSMETEDLFA